MSTDDAHFAWTPTQEQAAAARLRRFIDRLRVDDLDGVARMALDDPQRFWAAVVDDIGVDWTRRFDVAMDASAGLPWTRFWRGGQLNLAHNAVTRWARRAPEHPAVVWEGDDGSMREWTYAGLQRRHRVRSRRPRRPGGGHWRQCRPVPADDSRRRPHSSLHALGSAPSWCRCSAATAPVRSSRACATATPRF